MLNQPPLSLALPAEAREGDGTLVAQGSVSIPTSLGSDLVVDLASDDTSEVTVPATVTILAGDTSADFDLTVVDDSGLDGSQQATVTAAAGGYMPDGQGITVHDNETATLSVTLPVTATEGDGVLTGQGSAVPHHTVPVRDDLLEQHPEADLVTLAPAPGAERPQCIVEGRHLFPP